MTDLTPTPSAPPAVQPDPGHRAVRLTLLIPQAAIMKKCTLPTIADPWQSHEDENDTWVYRFMLESRDEVDAATKLVYAWGLKLERVLILGWGVRLSRNYVGSVLTCLQQSYEAQDYRAHCWTGGRAHTIENEAERITYTVHLGTNRPATKTVENANGDIVPDPAKAPIFMHPCRYAQRWEHFTTMHPVNIRAQIEATLVYKDCRWCPRLDDLDSWEQEMWGRQRHDPFGPIAPTESR